MLCAHVKTSSPSCTGHTIIQFQTCRLHCFLLPLCCQHGHCHLLPHRHQHAYFHLLLHCCHVAISTPWSLPLPALLLPSTPWSLPPPALLLPSTPWSLPSAALLLPSLHHGHCHCLIFTNFNMLMAIFRWTIFMDVVVAQVFCLAMQVARLFASDMTKSCCSWTLVT